jgi:hypothetical protein
MLLHHPRESLSHYVTGMILVVSAVSSTAFTIGLTGKRQFAATRSSMLHTMSKPRVHHMKVGNSVIMSLDESIINQQWIPGKGEFFQDFLTHHSVQVLICFASNLNYRI